jgi:hypothetical protein
MEQIHGTGSLGKSDELQFDWEDILDTGHGTLRFSDGGKSVSLCLDLGKKSSEHISLVWDEYIYESETLTRPSGYLVYLPTYYLYRYLSEDYPNVCVMLSPRKCGVIFVSVDWRLDGNAEHVVRLQGNGSWESGDRIVFSFTDDNGRIGKGALHFLSAKRATMSLQSCLPGRNRENYFRRFNADHYPLSAYPVSGGE